MEIAKAAERLAKIKEAPQEEATEEVVEEITEPIEEAQEEIPTLLEDGEGEEEENLLDDFEEEPQGEPKEVSSDEPADYVPFKYNGKEVEVTVTDLIDGWKEARSGDKRQSNYTKRFQELAEKGKQVETKEQEYDNLVGTYKEKLDLLESIFNKPQYTSEQLKTIKDDEGIEAYIDAKEAEEQRIQTLKLFENEKKQLSGQEETQLKEKYESIKKEQQAQIKEKAPELLKKENGIRLNTFVLNQYGFNQQEITAVLDHRFYLMAEDARKYNELLEKSSKKRTKVPRVQKKTGVVRRSNASEQKVAEHRSRLRKTGDVRDAANLYGQLRQTKK